MESDKQEIEASKKLLEKLDDTLKEGPWDKTILLRTAGKKLRELRFRLKTAIDRAMGKATAGPKNNLANRVAERTGQQEVFVYLYNADGTNMFQWVKLIRMITSQAVSRPIYGTEADVKELIRSKPNPKNEAYLAIYIKKSDIVVNKGGLVNKDKLEHELVQVKDKALQLNNITRFVHITGVYLFQDNQLIKQDDISSVDFT